MKRYLLTIGSYYYPQGGDNDWIACFETYDEAKSQIEEYEEQEFFQQGPRKGQVKETRIRYKHNGEKIDWFEIVDLNKWIFDKEERVEDE